MQRSEIAEALTGYAPTEEDLEGLRKWFETYDALAAEPTDEGVERMADLAVFPLNLVTDGSGGDGWTGQWDRAEYVRTMRAVMGGASGGGDTAGGTGGELRFESTRTPFFLTPRIAVVFTEATMTTGDGEEHRLNYADVLVRRGDTWAFQTMIQGGWADMLEGGDGGAR
ncbi:nuclear transport factor 2 family protein [Streptomyces sp. TRM43335]|uniref:Nuclear transport factor 2 family protein n=1 Tax=Streptomyces taklimakanensis TaxID=2569853 RepID=A0A6G2BHL2_9ACTN|nr:nuclear transport factor 2 family protein [Streptomyces taklimakanensis]MTE21559.1 nuclear transport factor 2 family protein [Streptomyces taklimakanensis]